MPSNATIENNAKYNKTQREKNKGYDSLRYQYIYKCVRVGRLPTDEMIQKYEITNDEKQKCAIAYLKNLKKDYNDVLLKYFGLQLNIVG